MKVSRKTLLAVLAAVIALPVSPFLVAGFVVVMSWFNHAEGAPGGAERKSPCAIYRDNLYRNGVPPGQVIDLVAYCISNVQQLQIRVLRDPDEIADFRKRTYIAPPALVEKTERSESHE